MAKNPKIDWAGLKTEYLKSDIKEVKLWYKSIWRKWNGWTQMQTKTWAKDKIIFLDKINEKAQKKIVKTLVEQKAVLLTNMEKAKIAWLNELTIRLTKNIKTMQVSTIWSIINIFNSETELDWDRVDNSTSINALRKKIKEEQKKRNMEWWNVKNV